MVASAHPTNAFSNGNPRVAITTTGKILNFPEMSDVLPDSSRKWRACMLCSLIKSPDQFVMNGCENCESLLQLRGDQERTFSCTSPTFEGLLGQLKPSRSWICKWQRTDKFVSGLYAIQVVGQLPQDIQEDLSDKGIKYRPRDGTLIE